MLDTYEAAVRREIARSGGREVNTAGDSFFVIFNDPVAALAAAARIRGSLRGLGLEVRIGIHVGECQIRSDAPTGLAVHVAARVMSAAEAGEIVISADARDAVASAGIALADHGTHSLKGVPGEWRLFVAEPDLAQTAPAHP
jgi:class 3 adenylate cyclase